MYNPVILGPSLHLSIPTDPNQIYVLEATDTLPSGNWNPKLALTGDGKV